METPSTNPQKKAPPLESLTKEELLAKYTGLRTLALKAKTAHNECQEDNKRLTEKIQQMEAQKTADKDCLKAMQEIVDSLTQFKLEATTQLQETRQANTRLLDTIKDMQLNQSDTEELAIENEALKRQVKRLTDENEELFADLQNSTEQKATESSTSVDDLNQRIAELQRQIEALESDQKKHQADNSALKEKSANFDKQFKELLAKSDASTKKLNMYKTKLIEISNKLKALKTTKKVLLEVVKDYAQTIPKWQKEILNASNKVFEKLTTYEKENRRLKAEIEELRGSEPKHSDDQVEKTANQPDSVAAADLNLKITELEQVIAAHETAKQTLTAELETLKATVAEKSASLVQFKDENKELLEELKEINQVLKERGEVISLQMAKIQQLEKVHVERSQQLVKDKDAAISHLTQELQTLREKVHSTAMADTQSEVMSTSTISKADESARMREIEDSFEEKYFKLKSLAVRLKKKNTEQAAQLIKLESAQKKEAVEEPTEVKAKDVPDSGANEYQAQVALLKKEKEAFNLAKKELEAEIQRLKATIKAKEQEIQEGGEAQKALKAELEKLKVAAKKNNVLSLEMDAYEKSLNDINAKLKAKKIHCDELEGTIDAQTKSIDALKHQIQILEDSLDGEKQHSRDQKHQLDLQQSKLRESEHGKAELAHQLEQEAANKERLQLALDEARLEVSTAVAEREKLCGSLEADRNQLAKQVLVLESDMDAVRRQLKDKDQECDEAKTEFASYKIRAQSVLRSQTRDSGREHELDEEVTMLRQNLEKATGKLAALEATVESATKNCEELQVDKQRLQTRADQLMELIEEARVQCETLMDENRRQVREHQEALKTQRLQYETLTTCYKQQIKDLEEKHVKELENLSQRLPVQVDMARPTPAQLSTSSDEHKINLILMQREEGEGSESSQQAPVYASAPPRKVSTSSRGNKRELMPLDELLNSSHLDDATSYVDSEYERPVSPTIELQRTQTQLVQQESRVKHLTSLLAEAEQDLAKLTQLNELLKEEVRRQQRSIERSAGLEQHIHNSEYLKNVIFKFLTLNSCDEKIHLVPVLNTILKLSPDETQKLQNVAKGEPGGALGWVTGKIWSNN